MFEPSHCLDARLFITAVNGTRNRGFPLTIIIILYPALSIKQNPSLFFIQINERQLHQFQHTLMETEKYDKVDRKVFRFSKPHPHLLHKNTKEFLLMNFLTRLPVFDKLTKEQQATLANSAFIRKFRKGEILHNGSQGCTGLILVIAGQIRAFTISEDGREITMYRLFERDICLFSASCMMNSIQFDMTISAEKDTEALVIPSEIYKDVMETSAALANYTNEVMASRFSDVMWLVDQVLWKSLDKRLAGFLLNETVIEGTNTLKITHETIGNHLGNPREVITRMLKYFVNEGLIRLSRGTIEIIDEKGLQKITD